MDWRWIAVLVLCVACIGCRSPYRSDQGALMGGLVGAGTGALIGDAVGEAGAGAAIGAGVGALTGGAIGSELDQIEAENRAMIAQQMGRPVAPGSVTIDEVIMMTQAGVDEQLIVNHVRANGVSRALTAADLVALQQQNVSRLVIQAMQDPPRQAAAPPVAASPAPVIVEEYHYGVPVYPDPCFGPPRHHYRHVRPGVHWGLSFEHH